MIITLHTLLVRWRPAPAGSCGSTLVKLGLLPVPDHDWSGALGACARCGSPPGTIYVAADRSTPRWHEAEDAIIALVDAGYHREAVCITRALERLTSDPRFVDLCTAATGDDYMVRMTLVAPGPGGAG